MKLFFYIVKLSINNIVSLGMARPAIGVGINILITLFTLLYGIAAALFYQYLTEKQLLTHFSFLSLLHFFLFLTIIVSSFFPQYRPFSFLFFPAYPLKSTQKSILQLVYSFITPLYFYLLLFILSLYITAGNSFSLPESVTTCLLIANSYLVLQIIKIQLQGRFYVAESIITLLLSTTLLYLNQYKGTNATFICLAAVFIFLLLCIVFTRLYTLLEKQETFSHTTSRYSKNIHNATLAFLRKKTVFPGFLIAVLLKLLYSALVIIGQSRHKIDTDFSRILFPLICSPVIYFTYIFNNFFGYQRQQIVYIGYINTINSLLKHFLSIIIPVLLLDGIVSGYLLYFTGTLSAGNTLCYLLLTSINCIIIGFSLSIMLPQKITKSIDIKKPTNTNFPGSIALVVLTILTIQLKATYWLLLQETVLVTAFMLFYYYYLKNNKNRVYTSLANNIV